MMAAAPIPIPFDPNQPTSSTRVYLLPPVNKLMIPQIPMRPSSRIVLVCGMPVMVPNDKIKQLFEHCGLIVDVWKNHLNIFLIHFDNEAAAFNALLMTGFTVVIESGMRFTSQLLVNYALEHEAKRSVIPFSREAYNMVSEKLSNLGTFSEGSNILTHWLKNGEVNRDNAGDFFTLLRITSEAADVKGNHVRKMEQAEAQLDEAVNDISDYLSVLDQVFNHEKFDSILDNFPERERQNLVKWKREFEDAKGVISNDQNKRLKSRKNKCAAKKKIVVETITREELVQLRQEKEDLELQLDVANLALVNERMEQQHEIDILKQSVDAAQRQCAEYEAQLADWRTIHAQLRKSGPERFSDTEGLSSTEAKALTELSSYLGDRPGATMSDIRNHLRKKNFTITAKQIVQLMRKFPNLFRQENVGSGPTKKIKWVYLGCAI